MGQLPKLNTENEDLSKYTLKYELHCRYIKTIRGKYFYLWVFLSEFQGKSFIFLRNGYIKKLHTKSLHYDLEGRLNNKFLYCNLDIHFFLVLLLYCKLTKPSCINSGQTSKLALCTLKNVITVYLICTELGIQFEYLL